MVHDSTMNPHKHISEEIRDQNVSIIFLKYFFYFVCETLLLIIEKNDEIVKINF